MKGSLSQRTAGSWTIRIELDRDSVTGKRRQLTKTVHCSKPQADKILRDMLGARDKGILVQETKLSFSTWLNKWLDGYVVSNCSPKTIDSYKSMVKTHVNPYFNQILLSKLTPQMLQEFYSNLSKSGRARGSGGLSPRTVKYIHRIISESLKHAMEQGLVIRNVASVVRPPKPIKTKLQTLPEHEFHKFFESCRGSMYYYLFMTLLHTGMRRGEALALKWKQVNLNMAVIYVQETAFKLDDGTYIIKPPKTPHSQRSINLSPSNSLLLGKYKQEQYMKHLTQGHVISEDDFVFCKDNREPLAPEVVTKAWSRILQKAGLPHIRLHDLRHTHATLMLQAGIHPKVVSERLGHANVNITLDTYSHVLPTIQQDAAQKLDDYLTSRNSLPHD